MLYAFESVGADLADYVGPVPLPGTWSLLLTGLGMFAFRRQRRS